jgi:phosphate transport system substrate-binding protein
MPTLAVCARLARMLAAAAVLLACAAAAQAAETLRISGNGSGRGGMQMMVEEFERQQPGVAVAVLPPLGSTGAIKALIEGAIDIVISSRPPTADERAQADLVSTEYARTPFVIAVHWNLGITSLTSEELAALYGEGAARFPNGRRARPVLRLADAGGSRLLSELSPAIGRAAEAASTRPGMLHADTESDAADLVERTPGAFAACTLALIESERRPLVALTIDGKVPSVGNLADGKYPYSKPLYVIIHRKAGASTRRFVDFVISPAGRNLLRAHGHWVRQ